MSDSQRIDRVDALVERILAGKTARDPEVDPELIALARVISDLRELPAGAFRERLRAELAAATRGGPARGGLGRKKSDAMATEAAIPKLTPYLIVRGAAEAITFYARVFGARERMRLVEPGSGRVGHAEMTIGDSSFMLADEYPEHGIFGPQSLGGVSSTMHLQVGDVDEVVARAVREGARLVMPVKDEFYGERAGRIADPFGHVWGVSTTKEKVSSAEMQERFDRLVSAGQGGESAAPAAPSEPPVSPIPPGFHSVTPYLHVRAADRLIDFVKEAFEAVEIFRTIGSAGGRHAEVRIGDSRVMIGGLDDPSFEEIPAAIYLYVPDVDATHERAVRAGAISTRAPADQPYGDRVAFLKDPFGNTWYIATHKKHAATGG